MTAVNENYSVSKYSWLSAAGENIVEKKASQYGLSSKPASTVVSGSKSKELPRKDPSYNNLRYTTFPKDDLFSMVPHSDPDGEGRFRIASFNSFGVDYLNTQALKLGVRVFLPINYSKTLDTKSSSTIRGVSLSLPFLLSFPISGNNTYVQLQGDPFQFTYLSSSSSGVSKIKPNINAEINSLGVYLDNFKIWDRNKIDLFLKWFGKFNYNGNEMNAYKSVYGAPELKDQGFLTASRLQVGVSFPWNDSSNIMRHKISVMGEYDTLSKAYYAKLLSDIGRYCIGVQYGKNNVDPIVNFYLGANVYSSEKHDLFVNIGSYDTFGKVKRSYNAGIGYQAKWGSFKVIVNFNGQWDEIRSRPKTSKTETPARGMKTWTSSPLYWEGLYFDELLGPQAVTHHLPFDTQAFDLKPGDKVRLLIGTANENHLDGITFKNPKGEFLDASADAKINTVTVSDQYGNLLMDCSSSFKGKPLTDISKGLIAIDMPASVNGGVVRYSVTLVIEANTGDFLTLPAVSYCKTLICVQYGRE